MFGRIEKARIKSPTKGNLQLHSIGRLLTQWYCPPTFDNEGLNSTPSIDTNI